MLFLRIVRHRMDEALVMELNNKFMAAFLLCSVVQPVATATLHPRLLRIHLVDATKLSPAVEFPVSASSFGDSKRHEMLSVRGGMHACVP